MPKKSAKYHASIRQNSRGDWEAKIAETGTKAVGPNASTAVRRLREAVKEETGVDAEIDQDIKLPREFQKRLDKLKTLESRYDESRRDALRLFNKLELERQSFIKDSVRQLNLKKVQAAHLIGIGQTNAVYITDPKYDRARRLYAIREGKITEDDPEFWRSPKDGGRKGGKRQ